MSKRLISEALRRLADVFMKEFPATVFGKDALLCKKRLKEIFDYTVVGGKCMRARLLLSTFSGLESDGKAATYDLAASVAACLEVLQAYFIILDDIVDGGIQRRGKPCWHTLKGVGLNAISDAIFLEAFLESALRSFLVRHPLASNVLDYFLEIKRMTIIGQVLDGSTSGLGDCTWERHKNIVRHKTSYYTTCAPIQLALLLADERRYWLEAEKICVDLGYLFQSQDDFLDCFGHPNNTGKNGTDLKEGKCTWITCKVAEKLNSLLETHNSVKLFQKHFGHPSNDGVETLLSIISSLNIAKDFVNFEKEATHHLMRDIEAFPHLGLRSSMRVFLSECLNRTKPIVSTLNL